MPSYIGDLKKDPNLGNYPQGFEVVGFRAVQGSRFAWSLRVQGCGRDLIIQTKVLGLGI